MPPSSALLGRLLLAASLAAVLPAASGAVPSGRATHQAPPSSRTAAPPAQADADDDDDTSDAALTRCQQRAQGRLATWDRMGDWAVNATRRVGRLVGASQGAVDHVLRIGHNLSEAVAHRLDCHEQQQAAIATAQAITGGVGTTARWRSDTRRGVAGSSSVTASQHLADGRDCLTVTDVIIIDGQEMRAPKHMCRRPPSNRYVRVETS